MFFVSQSIETSKTSEIALSSISVAGLFWPSSCENAVVLISTPLSLYTLYKLENGKSTNLKKINSDLLKMTYSIEKHELYIPRNFVTAVNFEFRRNGYLEEKSLNNE